jgi:hypothetical protein
MTLRVNNLIGFGARRATASSLLSTGGLTRIGDLTGGGGLNAAFDATTSQASAACSTAVKNGTTAGFVGIDWGSGVTKTIDRFQIWGSSDNGFSNWDPTEYNFTIKLQGSTDNFASSNVELSSNTGVADSDGVTLNVTSGITTTTAYRYHRISIAQETATGNFTMSVAEVQFYGY